MSWFKRFIWWKCLFWFALGTGLGAAVSIVLPEVGPIGAERIPTEAFVSILAYPVLTNGEHISAITVYPPHDDVEMLSFGLEGKDPTAAYVYAQQPFVRADHLKSFERRVAVQRAMKGIYLGDAASLAILRATERAAHMEAFRDWNTVSDFLTAMQALHPELRVQQAWWADRHLQRELPIVAGTLVIGALCSVLLARRSKEEQAAYELMRTVSNAPSLPSAPKAPTAEDLRRVRELDEALARNLAANAEASTDATEEPASAASPAVAEKTVATIAKLSDKPLEVIAEESREEKDYAGDFYPTEVRAKPRTVSPTNADRGRHGFSLIEMMVVIAILAVIMSILLPAMVRARQSADTIKCAANLHSIAQGMAMYLQANQNTFPAAYTYIGQQIVNGVQTPNSPSAGYVNWSSYLYGDGSVPKSAFTCPAMERGGLPPTNTTSDNMNPGQICPGPGVVDEQAVRLAYTVNEALCPRNKFVANFQSAQRTYQYVKANVVADPSITILATEMVDNGNMISYGDNGSGWIMSHRPIDGFCNSSTPDVYLLPIGAGFRPCTAADIDPEPLTETTSNSRLDLVGRNHGVRQSYPDMRLSNFAYVDGHVETKSIYDTVGPGQPFQWGAQFYSIVPNDDLQLQ
jgi:prepilin-type N-terminal cleavage/methylation domain-containing protein/prepilin-type processing-associated H-X9-DG protein